MYPFFKSKYSEYPIICGRPLGGHWGGHWAATGRPLGGHCEVATSARSGGAFILGQGTQAVRGTEDASINQAA